MVLTHTTNHSYAHPFPTVTLAFFLRYCSPKLNPFAQHVLSTDTISSHVDPATGRLHTTRIHLKKSRIPGAVLKLLPTSVTGGVADKASYILETSVVDIREGWMRTESRNVNFTGILSVVERQVYTAQPPSSLDEVHQQQYQKQQQWQLQLAPMGAGSDDYGNTPTTGVETTVVFRSRLGERLRERFEQGQQRYQKQFQQFKLQRQQQQQLQQQQQQELEQQQEQQQQQQEQQPQQQQAVEEPRVPWFGSGWVSGLGTKGVQRTIEAIASTKTMEQLGRSREGMHIILERLRQTGIIGVLELRRRAMEGSLDAIEAV